MALTKVCGPRRVVLCYELPGGHVVRDPALSEEMDPKAYAAALFDPDMVKVRPGQSPTWFTIMAPKRRQREAAPEGAGKAADWYIRCGVRAVEGFKRIEEDGRTVDVVVDLQPDPDLGTIATAKLLDDMDLDDFAKYALFGMIRDLCNVASGPLDRPSVKPPGPGVS